MADFHLYLSCSSHSQSKSPPTLLASNFRHSFFVKWPPLLPLPHSVSFFVFSFHDNIPTHPTRVGFLEGCTPPQFTHIDFFFLMAVLSPVLTSPSLSLFSSPFALFSDDTSCFTGDGGEVGVEWQQYSWCLRIFVPVVLRFNLIVYYYISIVSCEFTLDNQSPALMGVLGLISLMCVFFSHKMLVFQFLQSIFPPLGVTKSHMLQL